MRTCCALVASLLVVIAGLAMPGGLAAQQWIAPRVAPSRSFSAAPEHNSTPSAMNDPWIQPAAVYQPPGRAYAINDPFPGETPWGSATSAPTTVPPQGQFLSQPGLVEPHYGGDPCQPGVYYQGGCAPPADPYAIYAQPTAAVPFAGVGLRRAYAELEGRFGDNPDSAHGNLFVPFWQQPDSFWFGDIRGQVDDVDASEYNLGIGRRQLFGDVIFGLYGFYDYRETQFGNDFQGATIGVEALDLVWEGRFNWYIPESGAEATGVNAATLVNDTIVVQQGIERAYYGFDGEIGRLLYRAGGLYDAEVRGFIGGYYFDNDAAGFTSFGGPRARLEARLYDLPRLGPGSRVTFGGTVQYDEIRDTQGIASVNLRIPFGRGGVSAAAKLSPIERRMVAPIRRDDDIVVRTGLGAREQAVLVGNGKDGVVATNVTQVNAATADVPAVVAAGSDLVVVTGDIATTEQIVLNPNQFLGGQFAVRGQTSGAPATFGRKSRITATGADAIRIADNATVTGLNIMSDNQGINGGQDDTRLPADGDADNDGVNGFTISNNTINATADAIFLVGDINGDITGNTLTSGQDGLSIGRFVSGSIQGNVARDSGRNGFFLFDVAGGAITGNTATGNQEFGFLVDDFAGGVMSGNTSTGNGTDGYSFDTVRGGLINGNTATGNGDDGFIVFQNMSGGVFSNNRATNNADDGFTFAGVSGGTIRGNVAESNNTAGMGFGAFNFFNPTSGAAAASVTVSETDGPTLISGNRSTGDARDGFAFGNVNGGEISGNEAHGNNTDLGANGGNGGFSFASVSGTAILSNESTGDLAFDGFFFDSVVASVVNNNTATGNSNDGFNFQTIFIGQLQGNAATENGNNGFTPAATFLPAVDAGNPNTADDGTAPE